MKPNYQPWEVNIDDFYKIKDEREKLKFLLNFAVLAPSGENCQPWQFEILDNAIKFFNVPERDQSLYNFNQYGSLVAHGAALENIVIAARHLGYEVKVSLFPNSADKNLVAFLTFEKSDPVCDPLYDSIHNRTTNRKMYKNIPLTGEQRQNIFLPNSIYPSVGVQFTEDKNQINELSSAVSVNERLVFENRSIHDFFFSHLRLTDEENDKMRNGFYIKTLELQPQQIKAIKLFKSWNVLNIFNRVLGVSRKISKDNAKIYKNSAAIGIITISEVNDSNLVNAGRVFQRIWLKVTESRLSLQPVTGVLFFMRRLEVGETNGFTTKQVELVKEAYSIIKSIFSVNDKIITLLFRIGDGGEPSARSPRMPMENFIKP